MAGKEDDLGRAALEPTQVGDRIHALDAMRGVAITGVLFAETIWSLGGPPEDQWGRADHIVARGMDLFVDNKFLSMFACLFGVGIALQWRRWEARSSDLVSHHLRRMGFLLGIGLVHAVLLRNGDILAPYALLGLVLLLFRRWPIRWLAAGAIVLIALPYIADWLVQMSGLKWPARPDTASGSFLLDNLIWLRHWYVVNPIQSWPRILALMIAGLIAVRSGAIDRLAVERSLTTRALAFALAIAVLSRATYDVASNAWSGQDSSMAHDVALNALYQISSWSLAAAYASGFFLLCQVPAVMDRLSVIRNIGRMAFTNYLTQALLAIPICVIFGLFDTVSPVRGLVFGLAIGVVQFTFTLIWMRTHSMGPFERLWRRATYGKALGRP